MVPYRVAAPIDATDCVCRLFVQRGLYSIKNKHKKHLKNVGPIRHCEPFYIAIHQVSLLSHAATVVRRLRIDVHDNNNDDNNNDNA